MPVLARVVPVPALEADVKLAMSALKDFLARGFKSPGGIIPPPGEGIHHFLIENQAEKSRLHLRIEKDGHGLLLINASRAFHLNPTAAFMTYLFLLNISHEQAVQSITHQFRVPKAQASVDYAQNSSQIDALIHNQSCPICDLDIETIAPFSTRPSAPYRMDLALTYRCNNDCAHCYNEGPRQRTELTTQEWCTILDQLWEIGVPHIVFTGGEPTLRRDLPELIQHAEQNGQITGINTNARKLKDKSFVDQLVSAGLDHVQITLESHDSKIHDHMVGSEGAWQETIAGLKNVLKTRLFVMTNTTLLRANAPYIDETLDFLANMGVPTVGLNALIYSGKGSNVGTGLPETDLPPLLDLARTKTEAHHQRLIWYTPTQYCHFDPVQMELGVKGCTAALYNMCIEPDGAVLPCQSYYQTLGNIRSTPWKSIWNHELAVQLRERKNLPVECMTCALLPECGGGCPLARQAGI